MPEIKLQYNRVVGQLNHAKGALGNVTLDQPTDAEGNQLDITAKWSTREANIQTLVSEYIKGVQKNLEDTRANVDMLKDQDEAVVRN